MSSRQVGRANRKRQSAPTVAKIARGQRHCLALVRFLTRLSPVLPQPAEGVRAARQRCTPGDWAEPQSRFIAVTSPLIPISTLLPTTDKCHRCEPNRQKSKLECNRPISTKSWCGQSQSILSGSLLHDQEAPHPRRPRPVPRKVTSSILAAS